MESQKINLETKEPAGERVTISIGGEPDAASITLRFFGDELEPTEISKLLKCEPTSSYKKGAVIGKHSQRIAKTGTWLLACDKETNKNLETQISELLSDLSQDLNVWRELAKRFKADIYCGAWLKKWNRDIRFGHNLLKQISDRDLKLGIAIYCDGEDE